MIPAEIEPLIIVTHRHSTVFNCDKVWLLNEGKNN